MTDTIETARLKQRLRPLYIAAFFQGFVFWYAIEKLFMTSIGINNSQIAVIIVSFTLVMMLVNVPFGILADRWSRTGVLLIATLFLIAGSLVDGLSHSFWIYLIGSCLWGMYFACYSGTYDSIIYDTLVEETGSAQSYELYFGKIQLFDGVALVISSLLCGIVIHYFDLRTAYLFTVPFSGMALIALWRFREPQLHKKVEPMLLGAHIKETLRVIFTNKRIVWLALSIITLTVATRLILEFDQLWLIPLALPLFLYGPVNALLLAAYGGSGMVAHLLRNRRLLITVFGLVMVMAGICLLFHVLILTILAITILIIAITALEVVIGRWLHDILPSNIRAGGASTITTIGYAAFLPIGLLFGYISRQYDIFHASWIVVVMCVLVAVSIIGASQSVQRLRS